MPAERAGYTVTMFVLDVSPSMGKKREVELEDGATGQTKVIEMTNLEWAMRYIKLKCQDMIYHDRKTDQCGVILSGTEETNNTVNTEHGGYDHVSEVWQIAHPNAATLALLAGVDPTPEREVGEGFYADILDAVIVAMETQAQYLDTKRTWTRKMVIVTDGETPMDPTDWEQTVEKLKEYNVKTLVVGVDFDDEEFGYIEENKSKIKAANEDFWKNKFAPAFGNSETSDTPCIVATCADVLQDCDRPDPKETKSVLQTQTLRISDPETFPAEAVQIQVRVSKATAVTRPPTLKKFGRRLKKKEKDADAEMDIDEVEEDPTRDIYAQLTARTDYFVKMGKDENGQEYEVKIPVGELPSRGLDKVEDDELVSVYKYGASWVDAPEGGFQKLATRKGMDLFGVFPESKFRRDWAMGEVSYVWPDPKSGRDQVALSSVVQAMMEKQVYGYCRVVSRDDTAPKMYALRPERVSNVDCFIMVQLPFSNDVRSFGFESLTRLVSRKGTQIKEHPLLPTKEQLSAMEDFVDGMDLMLAARDDDGKKTPWFEPTNSYSPAVHRIKQALFHAAVVPDLAAIPLPPPHPDLMQYMAPPDNVLEKAKPALKRCKAVFNVKPAPPKTVQKRKAEHVEGGDINIDALGIAPFKPRTNAMDTREDGGSESQTQPAGNGEAVEGADSETEDEEDQLVAGVSSKPASPAKPSRPPVQQRTPSPSPEPVHRIIGTDYPMRDFRKNIKTRGDIVSTLVAELGMVVQETVLGAFASRRHNEMVECLRLYRDTAIKEDEIDSWNVYLPKLKELCTRDERPNNPAFWQLLIEEGVEMSLITETEANDAGGASEITDRQATEFFQT
ncbi:SPOC domain-like protein [Auriculariales sp. MPI-PUGE-AT-0066]|nr:SPOC domain-like protein [Auriculariales sp. MPI-PUGE-AT-0066]